ARDFRYGGVSGVTGRRRKRTALQANYKELQLVRGEAKQVESSVSNTTPIGPFMVYTAIVFALVGLILALSYVLGQHHKDRATGEPYESGIVSTGGARLRFPSQFYMVAMLFVIFDVEAVFIITWAIAFKELGWPGYISICVFIFILLVVLVY